MQASDAQREQAKMDYEAFTAEVSARLQFQSEFAQQALKSLMLVNGGAIVALFTLIGNSGSLAVEPLRLWMAFGGYVVGLAFTLVSYLCAFLSQAKYYEMAQAQAWNAQEAVLNGQPGSRDVMTTFHIGNKAWKWGLITAGLAWVGFIMGSGSALWGVLPA